MTASEWTADCVVVGAGPVGLAAAAALATCGFDVILVGAPPAVAASAGRPVDTRTAALFPAAISLLRRLGAWPSIAAECAPLSAIRIVDATGALLRAPELVFRAAEIGWSGFGYNVPQSALATGLWGSLRRPGAGHPVRVATGGAVVGLEFGPGGDHGDVGVTLKDGQRLRAWLVVAADGRNSLCRAQAGITARQWSYPQVALATRFTHGRPHHGISTELHTPAGPCTTVPLPDLGSSHASSLVWVERPAEAARLAALPDDAFVAALEHRLGGLLGTVSQPGPRRCFPLTGLAAETLGRRRVVLVGEAGHVIPPIGAQGLNLGLFDVAVLADQLVRARTEGADLGGAATLAAYAAARKSDIERRMGAVDVVNRMLISGLLPLSLARGVGLHMIAASAALRRRVMLAGLQPSSDLPMLMREEAARG